MTSIYTEQRQSGVLRSGLLTAWTNAWLNRSVPADDAVRAVHGADGRHFVIGLSDRLEAVAGLLIELRRAGPEAARLVLPAPGDVAGTPAGTDFAVAALAAGQGMWAGEIGVVPEVRESAVSSAPPEVVWRCFPVPAPASLNVSVADAEHRLADALRDAASMLAAMGPDVQRGLGNGSTARRSVDAAALSSARRAGERLDLPAGHPQRAVRLLAQAERLTAMLAVAGIGPDGSANAPTLPRAIDEIRERELRELAAAVRAARSVAYSAVPGPASR